jgi:hypothetical protein
MRALSSRPPPPGRRLAISLLGLSALALGTLGFGEAARAAATDCSEKGDRETIHAALALETADDHPKAARLLEDFFDACRGSLSPARGASIIFRAADNYFDARMDAECLRIVARTRDLRPMAAKDVTWSEFYQGLCGAACEAVGPGCARGAAQRKKRLDPPIPAVDLEATQPVPCNVGVLRKDVAALDKGSFYEQASTLVRLAFAQCRSLSAKSRAAVMSDMALVHFHAGDDKRCLEAIAELERGGALDRKDQFNRALCGGPCTADAASCQKAAQARQRAVELRSQRAEARKRLEPSCFPCKPGDKKCEKELLSVGSKVQDYAVAWDLRSARPISAGAGSRHLLQKEKLWWAGDLNGDGVGDIVLGFAARPGQRRGFFHAHVGCGQARFVEAWAAEGVRLSVQDPSADGTRVICAQLDHEEEVATCSKVRSDGLYEPSEPF